MSDKDIRIKACDPPPPEPKLPAELIEATCAALGLSPENLDAVQTAGQWALSQIEIGRQR